jgi:hypothetical protein
LFTVIANHDELTESEIIEIAMSAAPLNVSEKATIIGSDWFNLKRRQQWMDLHARNAAQ